MNPEVELNRAAWEIASEKHVREFQDLLVFARDRSSLTESELELLRPLLRSAPAVVHLQSGHGLDDIALVAAGARVVTGVDFSAVAATSAQRRAEELAVACRYVVAEVPGVPLHDACADVVYTGKGALIWMRDLDAWARDAARLLRHGGHLFVHEAHPAVPLWTWDEDEPRIRPDRSYFGRCHVNDTYPARGSVEWQWTLGEIINAVISANLEVLHLAEHPEPFWRPEHVDAAACPGTTPQFVHPARPSRSPMTFTSHTTARFRLHSSAPRTPGHRAPAAVTTRAHGRQSQPTRPRAQPTSPSGTSTPAVRAGG